MGYEEPHPHPPDRHPQQSQPAALDHDPSQPPLQGPPVIVSHYLSEPEAHDPVSTPHAGSESFTRKVWRAVRRAVPLRLPSLGAARQPFRRLDFWTASHPLSFKLRLYSVTEPKISMWQGFTWETLRYWNDLMSGEDSPYEPTLKNLEWLDVLERAEPFSE